MKIYPNMDELFRRMEERKLRREQTITPEEQEAQKQRLREWFETVRRSKRVDSNEDLPNMQE